MNEKEFITNEVDKIIEIGDIFCTKRGKSYNDLQDSEIKQITSIYIQLQKQNFKRPILEEWPEKPKTFSKIAPKIRTVIFSSKGATKEEILNAPVLAEHKKEDIILECDELAKNGVLEKGKGEKWYWNRDKATEMGL